MKYRFFQTTLPIAMFCILALPLYGQSEQPKIQRAPSSTSPQEAVGNPVEQAIEITVTEINLGKEAEMKTQNAHVKSFAQMMVKDHTDALAKLRMVFGAPTEDIKPSADHQKTAERLMQLTGSEFDREYIGEMVTGHQTALAFFEQQSKQPAGIVTGANPIVDDKSFSKVAADLVPIIRMHLEEAKRIQTELGRIASPSTSSRTRE
jgi:putative membrane protein